MQLCVGDGHSGGRGGASNVTVLSFPPGLFSDFPCNGGESGCRKGLNRFNWSALGAPLLAHRVRRPQYVPIALELLDQSPFVTPQLPNCKPMQPSKAEVPLSHCLAKNWRWCHLPFKPAPPLAKESQMAAAKAQEDRNKAHGYDRMRKQQMKARRESKALYRRSSG